MKINPIRGTHDLFGNEIKKFNTIISEVKFVAKIINILHKISEVLKFFYRYLYQIQFYLIL